MKHISCFAIIAVLWILFPSLSLSSGQVNTSILAWGNNENDQCYVPPENIGFVATSGGRHHSLGLKADGSIVAWGTNTDGQLNIVSPNSEYVAVAAGGYHSMGLRDNGSIEAWGRSSSGQCDVPGPNSNFIAISAGDKFSLGLKANGTVVAWGYNGVGQCAVPNPNSDFVSIAAGSHFGLGVKSDGTVVAWGDGSQGQTDIPAPNSNFVQVSGGWAFCMGMKSDGSIIVWGNTENGRDEVPQPNLGYVEMDAGGWHGVALRPNGTMVAWGDNPFGQLDVPPSVTFSSVAGGYYHSLGVCGSTMSFSVGDTPSDQGGFLDFVWEHHADDDLDVFNPITSYEIQREDQDYWVIIETVYASQADSYFVTMETPDIVTEGQPVPYSRYKVLAKTGIEEVYFPSEVDSAYSVDNLPPPIPEVTIVEGEDYRLLFCSDPNIPDLDQVCFYRDLNSGFVPDEPIQCSSDLVYNETQLIVFYYRVQYTDIHGNIGEFTDELSLQFTSGAGGVLPHDFSIDQNHPNPFNPQTTIAFEIPERQAVTLLVFDLSGRLVRNLITAEPHTPGRHEIVWNGKDDTGRQVASGTYFYRLEAGSYSETKRMVLIK